MKVLVSGDRNWTDSDSVKRELSNFPKDTTIIHGGARGADSVAGDEASKLGLVVRTYPANWLKHGKAAGILRNIQMLDTEKPDLILAFHPDLSKSKGTKHMVETARKRNIPVKLVNS